MSATQETIDYRNDIERLLQEIEPAALRGSHAPDDR